MSSNSLKDGKGPRNFPCLSNPNTKTQAGFTEADGLRPWHTVVLYSDSLKYKTQQGHGWSPLYKTIHWRWYTFFLSSFLTYIQCNNYSLAFFKIIHKKKKIGIRFTKLNEQKQKGHCESLFKAQFIHMLHSSLGLLLLLNSWKEKEGKN